MCTVTFIPSGKNFFITSNRDESPGRRAEHLHTAQSEKEVIHFPLDEASGGSWIALSDKGRCACLLNGAFEAFVPAPSYRLSRGLITLEALRAEDYVSFMEDFDLDQIAPFTLLHFDRHNLYELIWDGEQRHISHMDPAVAHIWSSVTLYPPEIRRNRSLHFENWISQIPAPDREAIISFHLMSHGDPHNDFVMNRNEIVRTLSITNVSFLETESSILHYELETGKREVIIAAYA